MGSNGAAVTIIVALIGAGVLTFLRDGIRAVRRRWSESSADALERKAAEADLDAADKSSIRLIRENTALAARNEQLYAELTRSDARHSSEREDWQRERALMRAEMDDMERRLRDMLDELVELRTRHGAI